MLVDPSRIAPQRSLTKPGPRDMLSQILRGMRLDGVEYERHLMPAPWSIAFPARSEASFHFIVQGGCRL